jgi:CRP-like cAMP-binding protein
MFANFPEREMHWVRWVLTIGWLLLIASLFYDPWTAALTEPNHPWSPLRLTDQCVQVQGECLVEQPYPIGATLFWGAIVPSAIFVLLVFGHELWRRICPLSFLSQIPRALGWQRQFKREHPKTGKVRYELAKVDPNSWLGRNYLYVQFAWLFIGLCGRILFFNADRLILGLWLLFTIAVAIAVGYWYGGKSWCHYFCPMAPVQTIFSEPGGLLGSKAHMSDRKITQSMCRTVLPDGNEQSACVACQSPCFDIDSERSYWDGLNKPATSLIRYGYVGLVIGYFLYYYLYAGNWNYYFSGIWNRDPNQLAALLNPGLYLFGQPINIPKLLAVPLVLGGFTAIGYGVGRAIESYIQARYQQANISPDVIRHRIFALCTFAIFNFFFIFAARPLILLTPIWVQYIYDLVLVFFSTLWLQKTWNRSPDRYSRENLASRFRKQLEKLQLDVSQYLEGRSLDDLHTNEVYVLAKVLPGFTREKRHEAYKGVVREALEEGYVNYSNSLAVLQQMRHELDISDDEHREVLEELGIEDSELLNPHRQRSLENQIRLSGYQKSLERLMRLRQQQTDRSGAEAWDATQLQALRREYSITASEEDWLVRELSPDLGGVAKIEALLARLTDWVACYRALNQLVLQEARSAVSLLEASVYQKQKLIVQTILETLTTLPTNTPMMPLVQSLKQLAGDIAAEHLQAADWRTEETDRLIKRLPPDVVRTLLEPETATVVSSMKSSEEIVGYIESLLQQSEPLVQATALYVIAHLDPRRAETIARHLSESNQAEFNHPIIQETIAQLLASPSPQSLTAFPRLEKMIYLFNSDFFHQMHTDTLMALADRSEVRAYSTGDVITEAGDTCRELLLLMEGDAKIHYQQANAVAVERLHPGQALDELEVLTHSHLENTIVADAANTRILAVPVDTFDDLLDHDPDFARRVLELESQRLQQVMQPM